MTATNKLELELLQNAAANQTLANTTFARLNQLVQAGVVDKDLAVPPASPADESLYIVGSSATGAWAGRDGQLAYWLVTAGAWQFVAPREGFFLHVNDEDAFYKFTGTAWEVFSGGGGGGGMTNPMTSIRDLIVGGVGGAPTRLPGPTSEGLVLTRIGNALAWAIATGFANPMNAGGDLIIGGTNGAATRLGAGTAGQVLTMVAGAPAWVTPSGGGGTGDFKKDGSVQMTAALNEAPVFNLDSASPAESIPDTAIALANTIKVSGTIGIRYLDFGGSSKLGTKRTLIFDNVLTLYHDLDYLILPGKVNITTAIGDSAEFVCEGPNPRKWRCVRYTRADGTALVGSAGFTEDQVRATVLTGLEPARDDVRATDTVLAAMGKLQASKVTKIDGMGLSATDFSQEEKTKLNGIQPGAQVNAVTSVAGRTGAVTLTKSDVGLANADNTADSAKPVSVAQQAALDAKAAINRPTLLGPVLITPADTASGDAALVVQRELSNTSAVNIPQSLGLNFIDKSKAGRLSAQLFRLTYTRDSSATGAPSSFDAMAVLTPSINANTPYPVRGLVMEGPSVGAGLTLQSWTALRVQAPSGSGSVTSRTALMIDPNAGNSVFGSTSDNGIDVVQASGSMSAAGPVKVGQYTLATLPSASAYSGYEIDVTNSTVAPAGPKRCRSNGTSWLILNTNTPVS